MAISSCGVTNKLIAVWGGVTFNYLDCHHTCYLGWLPGVTSRL